MAQKAKSRTHSKMRGKQTKLPTFQFPEGDNGLLAFTTAISSIKVCKSLKCVLEAIDLRMDDFGRMLGTTPQFKHRRPDGFSKGYISQLSAGRRKTSRMMLNAIGVVLSREITAMLNQEIGVSVQRNSPWQFKLAKRCPTHGPYELRGNRRRCPICKK